MGNFMKAYTIAFETNNGGQVASRAIVPFFKKIEDILEETPENVIRRINSKIMRIHAYERYYMNEDYLVVPIGKLKEKNKPFGKNRVEGQLFFLIGAGLAEAFMTAVWCIFIPSGIPHYIDIMALFTVLTSVSFFKFLILMLMITKLNIKYIVQEIDKKNSQCTEVQVKLDEIYQHIVDTRK